MEVRLPPRIGGEIWTACSNEGRQHVRSRGIVARDPLPFLGLPCLNMISKILREQLHN